MQEKCMTNKLNQIAFSRKCVKKTEATRMAQQSMRMQPNGQASRNIVASRGALPNRPVVGN